MLDRVLRNGKTHRPPGDFSCNLDPKLMDDFGEREARRRRASNKIVLRAEVVNYRWNIMNFTLQVPNKWTSSGLFEMSSGRTYISFCKFMDQNGHAPQTLCWRIAEIGKLIFFFLCFKFVLVLAETFGEGFGLWLIKL